MPLLWRGNSFHISKKINDMFIWLKFILVSKFLEAIDLKRTISVLLVKDKYSIILIKRQTLQCISIFAIKLNVFHNCIRSHFYNRSINCMFIPLKFSSQFIAQKSVFILIFSFNNITLFMINAYDLGLKKSFFLSCFCSGNQRMYKQRQITIIFSFLKKG
jgi:hypothetical protein